MRRSTKLFQASRKSYRTLISATANYRYYHFFTASIELRARLASYYNITAGGKNVDVRIALICVRKLAANSSVCGVSKCAALPL